jgi:hypothetical protein
MSKKTLLAVIGLIVLVGGWAAFRPELLFVNQTVSEGFPAAASRTASAAAAPVTLASGEFRSVAHDGRGTATIYQLPGGKRTLRFTNFETSNGPALHVYLVAAKDAADNDTVKKAGFIDLGPLKGNQGDQNYDLPAGVDLAKYQAVTVWCQRFSVNFTTAPLTPSSR